MAKSLKDRLTQALIENKLLSEKDMKHAEDIQAKQGIPLSKVLVKEGIVSEECLLSIMSNAFKLDYLRLTELAFDLYSFHLI